MNRKSRRMGCDALPTDNNSFIMKTSNLSSRNGSTCQNDVFFFTCSKSYSVCRECFKCLTCRPLSGLSVDLIRPTPAPYLFLHFPAVYSHHLLTNAPGDHNQMPVVQSYASQYSRNDINPVARCAQYLLHRRRVDWRASKLVRTSCIHFLQLALVVQMRQSQITTTKPLCYTSKTPRVFSSSVMVKG